MSGRWPDNASLGLVSRRDAVQHVVQPFSLAAPRTPSSGMEPSIALAAVTR